MNIAPQTYTHAQQHLKTRKAAVCNHPSIFTDIYDTGTNIAIWQRALSGQVRADVTSLLDTHTGFQKTTVVSTDNSYAKLIHDFGDAKALAKDIAELVGMFCLLFDCKQAGLRLTLMDHAMCPRFHVDSVPCRLVSTYHGPATQWLPHNKVDRTKLGRGNNGLADEQSGLFADRQAINQLACGDVAILKGELWQANENAGLVHRSPEVAAGEKRLLLTLDFFS